jgi:hypothetical protein
VKSKEKFPISDNALKELQETITKLEGCGHRRDRAKGGCLKKMSFMRGFKVEQCRTVPPRTEAGIDEFISRLFIRFH